MSLAIENVSIVLVIAKPVHAPQQSWISAQMLVASVWQNAKNTQVMTLLAKPVRKPVGSVSNTVKPRTSKLLESIRISNVATVSKTVGEMRVTIEFPRDL